MDLPIYKREGCKTFTSSPEKNINTSNQTRMARGILHMLTFERPLGTLLFFSNGHSSLAAKCTTQNNVRDITTAKKNIPKGPVDSYQTMQLLKTCVGSPLKHINLAN